MGFDNDEIDGFMAEAFQGDEAGQGASVLEQIERLHGAGSSVLLRETDADAPSVMLRRDVDGAAKDDPRYQILGEIARGGIGVIYRGRDKDLNRDVALKVLRPEYADRADVVQRFVEEAQIGGQLQHPGIVPVYGLGLQPDGRPCFAMRLIKGETLAELLDENPRRIDLLAVFEQVALTMAYAHSRGVIHRDLKPANVMIGAFGEVQVVDWGFAKVLGQAELTPRPEQTVIATVRSEGEGSHSMAGSVMGTPAYMPPEQALGRIDELDERCDVFALGAILCEILTGKPPYTGDPRDVLVAASQSRLDDAYARLDAAEAADGLKQLVRDCLAPMSAERPKNAHRVAERLAGHLADVENSARQAQLDAIASEEEAARQRDGRRRTLVLAGLMLFAVFVGGGGYGWWKSGRDARQQRAAPLIATALREATHHEGERDWAAAAAAAKRAVDVAASEGVDDAGARAMLVRFETARDAAATEAVLAAADARFLADLEEAWAQGADHYGWEAIDAAFVAAIARRFPDMEVDTERLRTSPDAAAFAATFDGWAHHRRTKKALEGKDWQKVDALARAIDPEHDNLRDAMRADDSDAVEALVETLDLTTLSTGMIYNLGLRLWNAERYESALSLMERAHALHPGDFWINWRLASSARKARKIDIALEHYAAAVSARPKSREVLHYYGATLFMSGDFEGALAAWQDGFAAHPDWAHGLGHIADTLHALGRNDKAIEVLQDAIAANPNDYGMVERLGFFFRDDLGDIESAMATFRSGIQLVPDEAWPYSSIGKALNMASRFGEAIPELERAIEIDPDYAPAYINLATAFVGEGAADRAIEILDRMPLESESESEPDRWKLYQRFAKRLSGNRHWDAAIHMARSALELAPGDEASAHAQLGEVCLAKGIAMYPDAPDALDEAVKHYQRAIELDSENAAYHLALGNTWYWKDDNDAAVPRLERALALDPGNPLARNLLGNVLNATGEWRRTVAMLRQELEKHPRNLNARMGLASTLARNGAADEAVHLLRDAVAMSPRSFRPRLLLCVFLSNIWRTDDAIREYEAAIADFPDLVNIRAAYAGLLSDQLSRYGDAAVQYQEIVERDPRTPSWHYALGTALHKAGRTAEALPHLVRALELAPEDPQVHCNLGLLLRALGRWSDSLDHLRQGHELGTKRGTWPYPSERWGRHAEAMVALEPRLAEVVAGTEVAVTPEERVLLGEMLAATGHFPQAAKCYQDGFREDPALMEIGKGHRNKALSAFVQAGAAWHPEARALLRDYIERQRAHLDDKAVGAVLDILTWRSMAVLASVHDGDAVSSEWKELWAELDALYDDAMKVVRK